jgi:8-oxo-dGTP diphosphatase
MLKKPDLSFADFLEKGHQYYLSHLSIDCVIFGFHDNQLKVLLLQFKETEQWCLPGGFILKEEHIEDAAVRILKDRTQLDNIYLHQFYTFGSPNRGDHGFQWPAGVSKSWILDRIVTIGYWALVEFSKAQPAPDVFSLQCTWWDIDKVPAMVLDHNKILEKALASLRLHLNDYPVGRDLLPEKFTMPELQKLYETIFDKKVDRRNFQKKMLSFGILEKLKERKKGGAHKAPFLYKFDAEKYKDAMKQGLKFGI